MAAVAGEWLERLTRVCGEVASGRAGVDDVEVTATLAEHGRRSLDLPDEERTAPVADHPELAGALGL